MCLWYIDWFFSVIKLKFIKKIFRFTYKLAFMLISWLITKMFQEINFTN